MDTIYSCAGHMMVALNVARRLPHASFALVIGVPGQGHERLLSALLKYFSHIETIRIILAGVRVTCTADLRRFGVSACIWPALQPVHGEPALHVQGRARAAPIKGTRQACFHRAWLGSVPRIRVARAAEAR